MIKVSRLADYAVVVMAAMAGQTEKRVSAALIAEKTGLPEPTVAKVLKILAKSRLALSTRGAGGGYRLAAEPRRITVADIVEAVDGPIALTACVEDGEGACDYACLCPVKGRWDEVNMAIRNALESVTLADMMAESCMRRSAPAKEIRV